MDFRTELNILPAEKRIFRTQGIFTIGSCFAEVMGLRLYQSKANVMVNPFGTVFNPISANKLLKAATLNDTSFLEEGLVHREDVWFHYDFHSSFHHTQPEALLHLLKLELEKAHAFLKQTKTVLLTWGTAYVYERLDTSAIVANCHKIPQKAFSKRLLTLEEVTQDTQQTVNLLQAHFSDLQVILTVSPVRHLKDTLPLNNVSKSLLRLASHLLVEQNNNVSYFPAYELVQDDLRDYRFYQADLIHPSLVAEEYIWQKFIMAYGDSGFLAFLEKWEKIQRDLNHRPFNPSSASHQKFLQNLLSQLEELSLAIDVKEEIRHVQQQLFS